MANLGYLVCYPFAALLRLFYNLTNSYGLSLILFTLVIKLVMLPFQIKSKKSMMRVTRMNGRMQEIQRKYANNQIKMNQEMQKLYEEEGANPMSGCLWSFLPLPIMIALYSIIREPIKYFMNFGSLSAGTAVLESAKKVVTGLGLTWSTIEKTGADSFYAQIIAGETELNDTTWNDFVANVQSMGADQLLGAYQTAVERIYGGGAF